MSLFPESSEVHRATRSRPLEQSELRIAVQRFAPSPQINRLVAFFSNYLVPPDKLEIVDAFGWGLLLSKISGYRKWWWLSGATILSVRVGTFALYHGLRSEWFLAHIPADVSMHVRFGIILASAVLCNS